MSRLRIPKQFHRAVGQLATLDDASVAAIADALRAVPVTKVRPSDLVGDVVARLPEGQRDATRDVVDFVLSLYIARATNELTAERLADDLRGAIEGAEVEELRGLASSASKLRDRVVALLGASTSLQIGAKALDLSTEFERTLCEARIVTDVRPIFGVDVGEAAAAIVVHTLRLQVHEGDEIRDVYVTLHADDIKALRALLDRAEVKENSLVDSLRKAGIGALTLPKEH
ncbi:MAG: hypothetical protein AABZ30_06895 [Myxococcota bacterium]